MCWLFVQTRTDSSNSLVFSSKLGDMLTCSRVTSIVTLHSIRQYELTWRFLIEPRSGIVRLGFASYLFFLFCRKSVNFKCFCEKMLYFVCLRNNLFSQNKVFFSCSLCWYRFIVSSFFSCFQHFFLHGQILFFREHTGACYSFVRQRKFREEKRPSYLRALEMLK